MGIPSGVSFYILMPKEFEMCVKGGGKVRTVSGPSKEHGLKDGEFVRFCMLDGKSHRGETMTKKMSEIRLAYSIPTIEFDENGKAVSKIELVPAGKWNDSVYGDFAFDSKKLDEMIENFSLRSHGNEGIPITIGHPKFDEEGRRDELPAVGWIKKLIRDTNDKGAEVLKAVVEWTEEGAKKIKEGAYKFISPEIDFEHKDPETGDQKGMVLLTAALTNFPFFKELATIKLSEVAEGQIIGSDHEMMKMMYYCPFDSKEYKTEKELMDHMYDYHKIERGIMRYFTEEDVENKLRGGESTIMARTKEELKVALAEDPELEPEGDEEKELLDELKAEEVEAKAEEVKAAEAKKEEEAKTLKLTEEAKGKTVMLSESEVKEMRESARQGKEDHLKLVANEVREQVSDLTFSESNKDGKILSSQAEAVTKFALSLNEGQRSKFFEVLETFKSLGSLFEEIGKGGEFSEGGSAPDGVSKESHEIDLKVKKLMSERDISYAEGMKILADEEAAERQKGK